MRASELKEIVADELPDAKVEVHMGAVVARADEIQGADLSRLISRIERRPKGGFDWHIGWTGSAAHGLKRIKLVINLLGSTDE